MSNFQWNEEIENFIIENRELTGMKLVNAVNEKFCLNLSKSSVLHKKQRLLCNVDGTPRVAENRHHFTDEQCEWLKTNTKGVKYPLLTVMFNEKFSLNLTQSSIEHKCFRLGVTNGVDSLMKKGNKPINYCTIGTIKAQNYKGSIRYVIKISDGKWELYSRFLYKKYYGEIPKGYQVIFKNRDTSDVRIENLMLVHKTEYMSLAKHNQLIKGDEKNNETLILCQRLLNKINKL